VSIPFYVPPEQLIKDRSDFARAGVAKGKPVVIATVKEGIALVTENPSASLRKISEIYDRIAFAGVGRYHEFEALRVAGIRYADLRGYAYDRADVTARSVAAAYAQTLGAVFTGEPKPLEVELAVVEVGDKTKDDQFFKISCDGSVAQITGLLVIGGGAKEVEARLRSELPSVPRLLDLLLRVTGKPAVNVEAALLRRGAERRAFARLGASDIKAMLARRKGSA